MANLNNIRISLRKDNLVNWKSANPILKDGEIAIVIDNNNENIKIGNGISSFTQLPYLYENNINTKQIHTDELRARAISQGYNTKSTPTSMATGIFTEVSANFGVVHGIEAQIKEGDDYAFVFNGENLPGISERYYSHGEGSFSVNPLSGLNGFYIGEENLSSIFSHYFLSNEISNYYDKQQINGIYIDLENKIIAVDNKLSGYYKKTETSSAVEIHDEISSLAAVKQDMLSSAINIKTINSLPILGSGDLEINAVAQVDNQTIQYNAQDKLVAKGVSDARNSGALKLWTGTKAQYDAIATKDDSVLYNVTDDHYVKPDSIDIVQTTGDSMTSVMSQKATTLADTTKIVYSPTNMFKRGSLIDGLNYMKSLRTFSASEIYNVNVVFKGMGSATTINQYRTGASPGSIIRLEKNSGTYLDFNIVSYKVYLDNYKNGTMLNHQEVLTFGSGGGDFCKSTQYYAELNLYDKKISIRNIINGTKTNVLDYDFSAFDISGLDTFNICTRVQMYSSPVMMEHLRVNSIYDYYSMLNTALEYGKYNSFETTPYKESLYLPITGVRVGGTLTYNTPAKKISNVSQASYAYFAMGILPESGYQNVRNSTIIVKFKVTSGTMTIGGGAGLNSITITQDGNVVYYAIGGFGQSVTVDNDVEYTLVMKTANDCTYCSTYGVKVSGTFTIEVYGGFAGFDQMMNLCAENFDGKYFKGCIAMESDNTELHDDYTNLSPDSAFYANSPRNYIATNAAGDVYITTNTAWKKLS